AAPRAIASTAAPRPAAISSTRVAPAASATWSFVTSGVTPTGSWTPASTRTGSTPREASRSRRNAYSRPFVSNVPRRTTAATPQPSECVPGHVRLSVLDEPAQRLPQGLERGVPRGVPQDRTGELDACGDAPVDVIQRRRGVFRTYPSLELVPFDQVEHRLT